MDGKMINIFVIDSLPTIQDMYRVLHQNNTDVLETFFVFCSDVGFEDKFRQFNIISDDLDVGAFVKEHNIVDYRIINAN